MNAMKAVILAGGLGTRLKPLTEAIPKPLLPVGEKAVLEIQIERLKKYGVGEIYIATNYKSEYIENFLGDGSRYGIRLFISKEDKPLGTAGPLKLLEKKLTDPFIVMNGDILSAVDFADFFSYALRKQTILTIAVKEFVLPYAFGNIFFRDELVTGIEEKPDIKMFALAGIYVMKPDIFRHIPADTYFGMDSLLKLLLSEKIPITKYEIKEFWLDIGQMTDYEKAREGYETHLKEVK